MLIDFHSQQSIALWLVINSVIFATEFISKEWNMNTHSVFFFTKKPIFQVTVIIVIFIAWMQSGPSAADTVTAKSDAQVVKVLPKVRVQQFAAELVSRSITLYGRTAADRETKLGAEWAGRVAAVFAIRGSYVQRGDVIAKLDINDLPQKIDRAKALYEQRNIEFVGAKKLASQGFQVDAQVFDVTCSAHMDGLQQQANVHGIDVLINNAGMQHVSRLEDFPPEKWQKLIDIMLVAPAMTTRAVLPAMKKNNFGRIVNVGSVHSLVASAYKSAYVAAKHGLIGLAKTVALESASADITINTLCPGYVDTPMVRDQIQQQAKAHKISASEVVEKIMLKNMPKKEFIKINELAGTVAFLIGPYAKNITAQAITIDGGWTAH